MQVNEQALWKLRNRIDVTLVSNEKDCLQWTSKPSYISQKIFDKDKVRDRKKQSHINT